MVHRVEVNVIEPFSERRFAHQHFIFEPRTLCGVAPRHQFDGKLLHPMHAEFVEAAYESLDLAGLSDGCTMYCADAIRTFHYGA